VPYSVGAVVFEKPVRTEIAQLSHEMNLRTDMI
jgi:hypothetical protein